MLISLIITLIIIIAAVSILKTFANFLLEKKGSEIVSSELVLGKNTLANKFCIISYSPNYEIIIKDTPEGRVSRETKSITITKSQVKNLDKYWNDICSMFNQYTYFDTFVSYFTTKGINIKVKLTMDSIRNEKNKQKLIEKSETNIKTESGIKNLEDIKPDPAYVDKKNDIKDNFIEMSAIKHDRYNEIKIEKEYKENLSDIIKFNPRPKLDEEKDLDNNEEEKE